jgi:hypothetical protein
MSTPIVHTPHQEDDADYYATNFSAPNDVSTHDVSLQESPLPPPQEDTSPHDVPTSSTPANPVQLAYEQVGEDTKFVRLTTITTLIHSIIFLIYIGFNGFRLMPHSETSGDTMTILLNSMMAFFEKGTVSR